MTSTTNTMTSTATTSDDLRHPPGPPDDAADIRRELAIYREGVARCLGHSSASADDAIEDLELLVQHLVAATIKP